jgi:DNA-binding HxlR family transcriptional regulator
MESITAHASHDPDRELDPRVEELVNQLIARVADKWTMHVLEVLEEAERKAPPGETGELRFTRLAERVPGISQKMLTQTLRAMERDGLLVRTVHPVIPPRVDYRLTDLGRSLGEAFCGVWLWAERHLDEIDQARREFDGRVMG